MPAPFHSTGGMPCSIAAEAWLLLHKPCVQLYQQHAQGAVTGYQVLETVTLQLGNAAAASYGIAILIMASAAWRTRALSRPVVWLSFVWGAIAVLSWPFIVIGAVGPIVGIVWSGWMGLVLWRVAATATKPPPVLAVGEGTSQR